MASIRQLTKPNKEGKFPWIVEYTDREGKRRRATPKSGLQRDAKTLRTKIEADMLRGTHIPDSQTATVATAIDLWLERCEKRVQSKDHLKRLTLKNWSIIVKNQVRPGLGHILLTKLTARDIQAWLEKMAYDTSRPVKRPTLRHSYHILRYILSDARERGLVIENVMVDARIRIPGRESPPIPIPTKAQVAAFLEESRTIPMGGSAGYFRPMLHVAVLCGLRLGEIRALGWENIDLDKGEIRVRVNMDPWGAIDEPKTRAGIRDVPMPANLVTELKRWHLACGRPATGLAFLTRTSAFVKESGASSSWRRLQHRVLGGERLPCKLPKSHFNFHALRHVYASLLIESGLPAKRIQYLMGHASIKMTFDRYGHLFENPELVRDAMARVGANFAT